MRGIPEIESRARDDARQMAKFVSKPVAHNRSSRWDRHFVGRPRLRFVGSRWSLVSQHSLPTGRCRSLLRASSKAVTVMAYPLMRRGNCAGETKEVVRSGRSLVAG